MALDIVDEYYKIVREITDSPEVFIRASAYHILSSTVGRFFRCKRMNQSQVTGFTPNTWFLMSSIPGATRRSTVTWYSSYTYNKIMKAYLNRVLPDDIEIDFNGIKKTLDDYERRVHINKTVSGSVIEEGTPEGLVDHINLWGLDSYSIVSTEFGSVLTKMFSREHQEGMSTLLSKLYYGEGGSFLLSQRGKDSKGSRYLPSGLYVTMFAGMQEPRFYIKPIMLRQGLLRRIILVYCKVSDMKDDEYQPPIKDEDIPIYSNLTDIISELINRICTYHNMHPPVDNLDEREFIDVDMTPQVTKIINAYDRENFMTLKKYETDLSIFRQGFWEHLTKISMLNAISRENFKFSGVDARGITLKSLVVERKDVDKAKSFLDDATRYSADVIASLSNIDVPIYNARAPLEKVFDIIKEAGDSGISKGSLITKSGMTSDELGKYTRTLLESLRISFEHIRTRGRPRTVFKMLRR